jgi:hypothetical protein
MIINPSTIHPSIPPFSKKKKEKNVSGKRRKIERERKIITK